MPRPTPAPVIEPLHDLVLIKVDDPTLKLPSGLLIPDRAGGTPSRGVVIATGPGALNGSERLPVSVTRGNKVLFREHSGFEVECLKGHVLVPDSDLLAVICEES